MSDFTAEPSLDLREQIARIDRARAESDKFIAEQRKLMSEAAKYDREGRFAIWQTAVAVIGGISGLVVGVVALLKAAGVFH